MNRIVIARRAGRDLSQIRDFVARDDRSAAVRVLREIRDRFKLLARNPLHGAEAADWGDGMRYSIVSHYAVIYRSDADVIEIVRVLHSARDMPSEMDDAES